MHANISYPYNTNFDKHLQGPSQLNSPQNTNVVHSKYNYNKYICYRTFTETYEVTMSDIKLLN